MARRFLPLLVAALALTGCLQQAPGALTPAATTLPGLDAASPLVVDPDGGAGEPSILVTEDALYIAAPLGSSRARADEIWKSTDGGATWTSLGTPTYPFGGGDTDLAVDGSGTIYMPGQWGARVFVGDNPTQGIPIVGGSALGYPLPICESMAVSEDGGESWFVNPVACVYAGAVDRQWVDTYGDDTAYMAFNAIPGGLAVVKSTDSGRTWMPLRVPSEGVTDNDFSARGNLATDKTDGTVYVAHAGPNGPSVWVSDGTSDFVQKGVTETERDVSAIFVVVAVGADGSVHTAWSEEASGGARNIMLSSSTDKGDTWTTPLRVNREDGTMIMPWIAAAEAGRVAVAWYGTGVAGDPNEMDEDAEWHGYLAVTTDAHSAAPVFAQTRTTTEPLHTGILCTNGSGCPAGTRRLLDFFEIAFDADGAVHVVMTDDTAGAEEPVVNLYVKAPRIG